MAENRSQINFDNLNSFNNQNNQINDLENNIFNLEINNIPTESANQEQKPSTKLSEEISENVSVNKYKMLGIKEESPKQQIQQQQIKQLKSQNQQNNAQTELNNQSNVPVLSINQNEKENHNNNINNQLHQSNHINEDIKEGNNIMIESEVYMNAEGLFYSYFNNLDFNHIYDDETVLGHNQEYLDLKRNREQDENEEDIVNSDFKDENYDSNYLNWKRKKKK